MERMTIRDVAAAAVEKLRGCGALTGVPIIEEDVGYLHNKLETEIAKRTVCVVVGWSGFTPIIQGKTAPFGTPFGTVGLVVSVFENPVMNRARAGAPTVCDIAVAVANCLHCAIAKGMAAPFWLKSIGNVFEVGEKATVTCDVNFETKTSL